MHDKINAVLKELTLDLDKFLFRNDEKEIFDLNIYATRIEKELSNKCKCKESTGWTTVMACNTCGFICDPAWQEIPSPKTELFDDWVSLSEKQPIEGQQVWVHERDANYVRAIWFFKKVFDARLYPSNYVWQPMFKPKPPKAE